MNYLPGGTLDFINSITDAIQRWVGGAEDRIGEPVGSINDFVWGPFLIVLLFAVGLLLTALLSGIQFRRLGYGLWLALFKRKEAGEHAGDISHYQALAVALAATVGVGNIAGVGTAIAIGGPGALFWMWVTGLLGMATKYSEALLGVKYRKVNARGEQSGGPQMYLSEGLKERYPGFGSAVGPILGIAFAVFGVIASFGIGNMVQSNSVASAVEGQWDIATNWTGLVIMIVAGLVILGGIKWIGRTASALVPIMVVLYITGALVVIAANINVVGSAFALVFADAFTGTSAVGGFAGATIMMAVRYGVARGIFSNESGLGTGGIAAAAAKTDQPVRQAMVSMTQTFIDTIVVVTMTGLVIIMTASWDLVDPASEDGSGFRGAALTRIAFESGLGGEGTTGGTIGGLIVTIGLALFAFSTLFGWAYYGEKCLERFTGIWSILPYRTLFTLAIYIGAVTSLDLVWDVADTFNGLMAFPNLIGLLLLAPVIMKDTREFFARPDWRLLPQDAVKIDSGRGKDDEGDAPVAS
jgi:AGCS family alanine or glycine:cation symporter